MANTELTESFDHDKCLRVLQTAVWEGAVDVVIFDGYRAFHDARVADSLLHLLLWLDTTYELTKGQRMKRGRRCSAKHFEEVVWPPHVEYRKMVFDRYKETTKWNSVEGEDLHRVAFDFVLNSLPFAEIKGEKSSQSPARPQMISPPARPHMLSLPARSMGTLLSPVLAGHQEQAQSMKPPTSTLPPNRCIRTTSQLAPSRFQTSRRYWMRQS